MKKIVYLVTEDWYFVSHRLELARQTRKKGYDIYVLTRGGDRSEILKENGFFLIPVKFNRGFGSPLSDLYLIYTIYRILRDIKPDILHNIALKPIVVGSIAGLLAGVPAIINTYTGLGHLFISSSLRARFAKSLIVSLLPLVIKKERVYSIVQNPDDHKTLLELGLVNKDRTVLIPGSGVDSELFNYSPEPRGGPAVVLFASRLLEDKGIMDFIGAIRLLKNKDEDIRFIVVGDRDESSPTSVSSELLEQWIDEGLIEWWGYRNDMEQVYQKVNIVCLPSYREGLPKVLLEAASSGRAIITTDVPGCRAVVEHGVNGLLVPIKDPSRIAEAIERLVCDPELRRQMGIAGRERVIKYFDLQKVNSETLNLYDKLL